MTAFDYDIAFSRNLGIVSEAEQDRLRQTRVGLPGLGGVGGGGPPRRVAAAPGAGVSTAPHRRFVRIAQRRAFHGRERLADALRRHDTREHWQDFLAALLKKGCGQELETAQALSGVGAMVSMAPV